jgi:CRP/FNR family cyclic AMP-dependent transcriptional regulator
MDKEQIIGTISRMEEFSGLSVGELSELAGKIKVVNKNTKETIFIEGSKGDSMFIIESGLVQIFKKTPEGEEKMLDTLYPRTLFGEMALVDGQPRSASAKAAEPAVLLEVTKADFDSLLALCNPASIKLLLGITRLLSVRLRKIDEAFVKLFVAASPKATAKDLELNLERLRRLVSSGGIK